MQKLGRLYYNDIIFKILVYSSFKFDFNKVDDKIKENLSGIKIQGEVKSYNFETIKGFESDNSILNNNYKKFLNFLNVIINGIKSKFSNDFNFKVTLEFKTDSVERNIFQINCKYQLEIPFEDLTTFRDSDILDDKKEEIKGFNCLISEINARRD